MPKANLTGILEEQLYPRFIWVRMLYVTEKTNGKNWRYRNTFPQSVAAYRM